LTDRTTGQRAEFTSFERARPSNLHLDALLRRTIRCFAMTWLLRKSATLLVIYAVTLRGLTMRSTALLLASLMVLAVSTANARDYKAGSLDIADPWSRATPKGATVGAGYMKITNTGTTPDRLISGSADVAPTFEVHEMTMDNGVAKMRPIKGGLEIKPGETIELKPGSFHVMFVGLKKPLTAGDHIKAALVFEKAGTVNVEYDVRAMGAEPGNDMPGMKKQGQ
jgi:periplasmic copper chaperone A